MKTKCIKTVRVLLIVLAVLITSAVAAKQKRILVFSKTAGFRHTAAIAAGKVSIPLLGTKNNFDVDTTENAEAFTTENLKKYAAVVFLCTTGNVLNDQQQEAFQQFIRSGGGFVGLHSAADTEYDWPWYGELNGGYFKSHPKQQEAIFNVVDPNNIATAHLPRVWKRFDELYNFKWLGTDLHVLITIDENSYTGGANGENHPMCWYHDFDGGRAFYTALGHDNKSYDDPLYLQHILGGIKYAMGANPTTSAKSLTK
ncbi:MAG: ThuA domain-containing protein [Bacteroidota bacterium]|nr:ThuA domain-containing protein [Bacteroidota bacterium]